MMKALLIKGDELNLEDVVNIAHVEGRKVFSTKENVFVPYVEWVEKLKAWIVVVELRGLLKRGGVAEGTVLAVIDGEEG